MQRFVVPQERYVHQPGIGGVEDAPVFAPTGLAKQPQDDADDDEHDGHRHQHSDHGRIDVPFRLDWFVHRCSTFDRSVRLEDGVHLETADAPSVSALGLLRHLLALLREKATLVDLSQFAALVEVVRRRQIGSTLACARTGIADRPGKATVSGAFAFITEHERSAAGRIEWFRFLRQDAAAEDNQQNDRK